MANLDGHDLSLTACAWRRRPVDPFARFHFRIVRSWRAGPFSVMSSASRDSCRTISATIQPTGIRASNPCPENNAKPRAPILAPASLSRRRKALGKVPAASQSPASRRLKREIAERRTTAAPATKKYDWRRSGSISSTIILKNSRIRIGSSIFAAGRRRVWGRISSIARPDASRWSGSPRAGWSSDGQIGHFERSIGGGTGQNRCRTEAHTKPRRCNPRFDAGIFDIKPLDAPPYAAAPFPGRQRNHHASRHPQSAPRVPAAPAGSEHSITRVDVAGQPPSVRALHRKAGANLQTYNRRCRRVNLEAALRSRPDCPVRQRGSLADENIPSRFQNCAASTQTAFHARSASRACWPRSMSGATGKSWFPAS